MSAERRTSESRRHLQPTERDLGRSGHLRSQFRGRPPMAPGSQQPSGPREVPTPDLARAHWPTRCPHDSPGCRWPPRVVLPAVRPTWAHTADPRACRGRASYRRHSPPLPGPGPVPLKGTWPVRTMTARSFRFRRAATPPRTPGAENLGLLDGVHREPAAHSPGLTSEAWAPCHVSVWSSESPLLCAARELRPPFCASMAGTRKWRCSGWAPRPQRPPAKPGNGVRALELICVDSAGPAKPDALAMFVPIPLRSEGPLRASARRPTASPRCKVDAKVATRVATKKNRVLQVVE